MGLSAGAFHTTTLIAFAWGAYEDAFMIAGVALPIPGNYFSKIVWLTIINLYLQIVYHLYSAYLSTCPAKQQKAAKCYHFLANTLFFPAAITVALMFWGLYLSRRDLIIPEGFADPMEAHPLFNHVLHTLPAAAMLFDRCLWNHGRTKKTAATAVMTVFMFLYILDIHVMHSISGFWPYGILAMLSPVPRMLFLLSGGMILFASFLAGDALNACLHPVDRKRRE